MKISRVFKGMSVLLIMLVFQSTAWTAPGPCQGPNKNNPGCPGAAEPPPPDPVVVDSVTVDWVNEKLIIRGSGFVAGTEFHLGSGAGPLSKSFISSSLYDVFFDLAMANEVTSEGNFALLVDGVAQLSLYIESQVIDPAADPGCPCETTWIADPNTDWWGVRETDCVEISAPDGTADIAGTILSIPSDPTAYPQFLIGASYYPGDPNSSVCRLVEVTSGPTVIDRINSRINAAQQVVCAAALKANVCKP